MLDKRAHAKNLMKCTSCRECIREENKFDSIIELSKVSDHFICNSANFMNFSYN